jgi:hypothetical protein
MTSSTSPTQVRDLLVDRLDALLAECDQVMDNAKYGRAFHDFDEFLLIEGKKFLKEIYQEKLQERIEKTEQQAETKQCTDCKKKTRYQNSKTKTVVSAHGHVTIRRQYHRCLHCKINFFPVEATLGLVTGYSDSLKRLIARCCGLWSYRLSAENMQEFCAVHLSHMTIGKLAGHTAEEIAQRLENNPDVRNDFQKAKGEVEFYADGVFVHIRNELGKAEWREFKVGAFAKRMRGLFALPSEWHTRKLPEPTVVSAFAAMVDKGGFQELCQMMRRRLGVGGVSSALGDGAKCHKIC